MLPLGICQTMAWEEAMPKEKFVRNISSKHLNERHTEFPAPVVTSEPSRDDISECVLLMVCCAGMLRKCRAIDG